MNSSVWPMANSIITDMVTSPQLKQSSINKLIYVKVHVYMLLIGKIIPTIN